MERAPYRYARSLFTRGLHYICPLLFRLKYQVVGIEVIENGLEKFDKIKDHRAIICPTHATEFDGAQMFFFSALVHEDFHYLAARELFRWWHGLYGRLLRLGGCFSVNRAVFDRHALRSLVDDLMQERSKLIVFPEGEVSHDFSGLLPLKPGAAHLAFKALDELPPDCGPLYILPVALSYTFVEDPLLSFSRVLSVLERHLSINAIAATEPLSMDIILSRLCHVCEALVMILGEKYEMPPARGTVDEQLEQLRQAMLARLGSFFHGGCSNQPLELMHFVSAKLDKLLNSPTPNNAYEKKIVVQQRQLAKILQQELNHIENLQFHLETCRRAAEEQTVAEILCLLSREVLGHSIPACSRLALVAVGDPIDIKSLQLEYRSDCHGAILAVNSLIARQLTDLQQRLVASTNAMRDARIRKISAHPVRKQIAGKKLEC